MLSKAIAERKIEKTYLALCRKEIPLGTVRHCFRRKSKSHENAKPTLLRAYDASLLDLKSSADGLQGESTTSDLTLKRLSTENKGGKKFGIKKRIEHAASVKIESENTDTTQSSSVEIKGGSRSGNQPGNVWQLAELEVLSCTALSEEELTEDAREHLKSPSGASTSSSRSLYECEIRLVTGRTHQIRLQLAAMGASIIGDSRYNPVEGLLDCSGDEEVGERAEGTRWLGPRDDSGVSDIRSTDSPPTPAARAVGDGEHLMGPEPKR